MNYPTHPLENPSQLFYMGLDLNPENNPPNDFVEGESHYLPLATQAADNSVQHLSPTEGGDFLKDFSDVLFRIEKNCAKNQSNYKSDDGAWVGSLF